MLRLLIGKDWKRNQEAVLERISQDIRERKPGRILLVPELASHEMERALCQWAGDTASRYGEVLSFTRLARRMSEELGGGGACLDSGGRVVAMAASARQLSSRLKTYAAVETKPEFLLKMIDALDEFKRCRIAPEDLRQASQAASGSLSQKLEELGLLMESYDAICARGKRDPRDQMTWLLERLEEGEYPQSHVFYIEGFPDFTRQHLAILECLIRKSPSVTVSLNCDRPGSRLLAFEKAGQTASQLLKIARRAGVEATIEIIPEREDRLRLLREKLFQGSIFQGAASGALETVRASSLWQECLWAAGEVLTWLHQGCRFRDVTVVCSDLNRYAPVLNLVFRRMHIPLYQSGTQEILRKSMVSTVLTALDAAGGLDRREVMEYLRSGLSPMDEDTCDLVENYTYLWGIRGAGWCSQWTFHPDGLNGQPGADADTRLERLNRAREASIGPLARLQDGLHRAKNLREQVTSLYDFLEEVGLERRMEEEAEILSQMGESREAQIYSQLWEILVSALEQMYDVLGDTHWETEHFTRLLRLLLSQYDVGTIPPVLDAVQMGSVSAMRCHRGKHLIVLGAEEGSLPGYNGSTGLLTDQERMAIRALGVPLTGGGLEGIQSEFAEIYGVFSGAEESVCVSCSGDQPSFLFRRLEELTGGSREADTSLDFAGADPWETGAYLARFGCADAARRLGAAESYRLIRERSAACLGKMTPAGIRGLYGNSLNLSASQIDTQAGCRLYYYLKYGLRAKERKEAAVDPAEFGTYVHAVLEHTVKTVEAEGGFPQVSLERTLEIAHRFSDSYAGTQFGPLASPRVQAVFQRNRRELDMVVEELWKELRTSQFQPRGYEVGFGREKGLLPPIPIPNGAMPAILRGIVDRVDVYDSPGSSYYRVVDYKTGNKDFDYCDIHTGVGLQMLIYLFTLEHSGAEMLGDNPVAAGVQYFPARAPYISLDGKPGPEEAEKSREEKWSRQGLLLEDSQVLAAMNPEAQKPLTEKCGQASREQMKLLEGYIFRVMGRMVEDIASGNVEPNPYSRGSKHDTCRYCPYGGICHPDTVTERRNYKTMTAQRFWEEIGKEMGIHG